MRPWRGNPGPIHAAVVDPLLIPALIFAKTVGWLTKTDGMDTISQLSFVEL